MTSKALTEDLLLMLRLYSVLLLILSAVGIQSKERLSSIVQIVARLMTSKASKAAAEDLALINCSVVSLSKMCRKLSYIFFIWR